MRHKTAKKIRGFSAPRERASEREFRLRAEPHVAPPAHYSIVENTEESLRFIGLLRDVLDNYRRVFVDLALLEHASPEAILCLAALLSRAGNSGVEIRGNDPKNPLVLDEFVGCGFFDHFLRHKPVDADRRGSLVAIRGRRLDPSEIRRHVAEAALRAADSNLRLSSTMDTLLEAVGNTQEHAATKRLRVQWWVSTQADPGNKKVAVTALDLGIGILRSANVRSFRKRLLRSIGAYNDCDLMKDVLEGRVPSRTGLDHRGLGLPKIAGHARAGRIEKAVLLSNSVITDLATMTMTEVDYPFRGTLLHWEISENSA